MKAALESKLLCLSRDLVLSSYTGSPRKVLDKSSNNGFEFCCLSIVRFWIFILYTALEVYQLKDGVSFSREVEQKGTRWTRVKSRE